MAQAVLVGNRQCGTFYTQLLKIKHSFKVTPISKALFQIIKERLKEVDSMSRQFKTMHAKGIGKHKPDTCKTMCRQWVKLMNKVKPEMQQAKTFQDAPVGRRMARE